MTKSSGRLAIGEVYTARHGYSSPEVADALQALTGIQPARVYVPGLAGPNELIQVLADLDGWQQLGIAIASLYGAELVKEAAKATWKAAAKMTPTAVAALAKALQKEHDAGNTVSLGLIEPTLDDQLRRDRIVLDNVEDADELARRIWIFSNCTPQLAEWINEEKAATQGRNPGPVLCAWITDEGLLVARIEYGSAGIPVTKTFDHLGKLVSTDPK